MIFMGKLIMTPLFPQIPDPTMMNVDRILRPYYSFFSRAILAPWQDFQNRRAEDSWFQSYTEPQAAGLMHTHVTNYAAELASEITSGDIRIEQMFGHPVYVIPEQLAITVKKLRRVNDEDDMYRSNYRTKRDADYWGQRRMEGYLDVPRVIIGYVFLEAMSRIEILVAYPRTTGLAVRWFYEMPALAEVPLRIAQTQELEQDDPEKEFNIVPKEGVILPDDEAEDA